MKKQRIQAFTRRLRFFQSYLSNPPWDSNISPPELLKFLEENQAGRALDIGCGTGTNAVTMAEYGWNVDAVDYIPRAIKKAKRKIGKQNKLIKLYHADFIDQEVLEGTYDLILDVGCYHSLEDFQKRKYEDRIAQYLKPEGFFLLYGFMQSRNGRNSIREDDITVLQRRYKLIKREDSIGLFERLAVWLLFTH